MEKLVSFEHMEVNPYLAKAEECLGTLAEESFIKDYTDLYKELLALQTRLSDKCFRLAVVGEFSSGKSTFLDALIGADLLKHGAKETTATITEIQNTSQDSGTFDVYFRNGRVETGLAYPLLDQYTVVSSQAHNVSKEIARVVIRSDIFQAAYPISFWDTPGLNGVADYHREQTIEAIQNAHACIYLLQVRGLGQSDIEFIKLLSKYQKNFIFVQNFIDELKALEGETPAGKVEEQEHLLREQVFNGTDGINFCVVGMSSRNALIAREQAFEAIDGQALTPALREQVLQESGFIKVVEQIQELAQRNTKENLQQVDTIRAALHWMDGLLHIFTQQRANLEHTLEGQTLAGYRALQESAEKNKPTHLKKLDNFVEAGIEEGRKLANKTIDEDVNKLAEKTKQTVDGIATIEALEAFIDGGLLANDLYGGMADVETALESLLAMMLENVQNNAVVRVTQYAGGTIDLDAVEQVSPLTLPQRGEDGNFQLQEQEIARLSQEELEARAEHNRAEEENEKAKSDKKNAESTLSVAGGEKERVENEKAQKIKNLGTRPASERVTYTDIEYHYRYHGGSRLRDKVSEGLDKLLGPKEVTVTKSYQDDSQGQVWDGKKGKVNESYANQLSQLAKQESVAKAALDTAETNLKSTKATSEQALTRANNLKRQMQSTMDEIATKKALLKQEYLNKAKASVWNDVERYLQGDDGMAVRLKERMQLALNGQKSAIKLQVQTLYELAFQSRMETLQAYTHGHDNAQQTQLAQHKVDVLEKTMQQLEECVCNLS